MLKLHLHKTLRGAEGELRLALDLEVTQGATVAIYGPSGAGKTTLLRMVAGLADPEDGHLEVGGTIWYDRKTKAKLPIQQRRLGMVFQDYALFPNMTVRQNLSYAQPTGQADPQLCDELLERSGLMGLAHHKPQALSGGQQQRVAVIRALAAKPRILLLDEPLSAQDVALRTQMQALVRDMLARFRPTTLLVTHDLGEVFALADQMALLQNGRLTPAAPPATVAARLGEGMPSSPLATILSIQATPGAATVLILLDGKLIKLELNPRRVHHLQAGMQVGIEDLR